MTPIDPNLLQAQCVHAAMLMIEGVLLAAFLTFCWLVAPYFINGGPRR